MASVVFHFQVHQPYRLRRYSTFDTHSNYFDDARNEAICRDVAARCYLPANDVIRELIDRHDGEFRVSYSLTGMVVEQLQHWCPEVLRSFQDLARTECVEFVAETYCHSLAFLYDRQEFIDQTQRHCRLMKRLFGQSPAVFRNTGLTYNNDVARIVDDMGFRAILTEGVDRVLGSRSPSLLYRAANRPDLRILAKHFQLSDDIAFRFNDRTWGGWPLTAQKFAGWVDQINAAGHVCNLFLDYETFGERNAAETGIFEFLRELPEHVTAGGRNDFLTVSEAVDQYPTAGDVDAPEMTSWADAERDLSAWVGNSLQADALHDVYALADHVMASEDPSLIHDWRRLQASEHFYYMCTKWSADAEAHNHVNPHESPYDAYITYMNVLDHLRGRLAASA